jgi:hypothetical protein
VCSRTWGLMPVDVNHAVTDDTCASTNRTKMMRPWC